MPSNLALKKDSTHPSLNSLTVYLHVYRVSVWHAVSSAPVHTFLALVYVCTVLLVYYTLYFSL